MTEMLLSTSRQVTPACHSYHAEVHTLILRLEVILSYLRFQPTQTPTDPTGRPDRLSIDLDAPGIDLDPTATTLVWTDPDHYQPGDDFVVDHPS